MPSVFMAHNFMLADDLEQARAYVTYFLNACEEDAAFTAKAEAS